MRSRSSVLAIGFLLFSAAIISAQTPTSTTSVNSSSAQALAALQSALKALSGGSAISDVTLSGSAERIAGSDDEIGKATYKALPAGNRLDLALSSGTRSEIRFTGASPSGTWTGPDGVAHAIVSHNLMTDPGWFPLFLLTNINSSGSSLVTYVGPETRNGESVIHLTASQQFSTADVSEAPLLQHLAQEDIYLDTKSFLLVSYVFSIHPDNNSLLDIPVEIRYSNYQTIGGVQIPLHIQQFINNTLALDIQFQNASLNTGITPGQITAQ